MVIQIHNQVWFSGKRKMAENKIEKLTTIKLLIA
jgi:hypothetical protein